jgi:hypothetical protein
MHITPGDTVTFQITSVRRDKTDKSCLFTNGIQVDTILQNVVVPDTGTYWFVCFNPNIKPFEVTGDITGLCTCRHLNQCCTVDYSANSMQCDACSKSPCNTVCFISICIASKIYPAGIIYRAKNIKVNGQIY